MPLIASHGVRIRSTRVVALLLIGAHVFSAAALGDDSIPYFAAPHYYPGVPILTFDQRRQGLSEIGSEYSLDGLRGARVEGKLLRNGYNTVLSVGYKLSRNKQSESVLRLSLYSALSTPMQMPDELRRVSRGIRFRAAAETDPITLIVEVWGKTDDEPLVRESRTITAGPMREFQVLTDMTRATETRVRVQQNPSDCDCVNRRRGTILLDDFYLIDGSSTPFRPPENDQQFLDWLKQSGVRYFLWNYREIGTDHAVVLEKGRPESFVSVSGLGMAMAAYILAVDTGQLSETEAITRITKVLSWLAGQNWYDGSSGWHGFPYHYFDVTGEPKWPAVSTVDWAICAAGIRTARVRFSSDPAISSLADELLGRPRWQKAVDDDGKVIMGFEAADGHPDPYRWGLAFSEETELVYLEALASNLINPSILRSIQRKKKGIFYPSWFGSGFTYNWLQLWTGPVLPYARNSRRAYLYDAKTSLRAFGRPIMGLTAAATITEVDRNGFFLREEYFSNQGSEAHGTDDPSEVVQIAPAPYGAALALSFAPEEAMAALREFVELGYLHPYLGLPDTVRIVGLRDEMVPVPSWTHFDLNIGAMMMAIDQYQNNSIGVLYRSDPRIEKGLEALQASAALAF